MAQINNVFCVLLLFLCCLVLHQNCYVINTDGQKSRESLFYYDTNYNETAATKCIPRSNCIKVTSPSLCDVLDIVCRDSNSNDENSPPSTDYSYFYVDNGSDTNVTFGSYDQPTHTYSHISSSTWGFLIMMKIIIVVFMWMFCCSDHRRSILFVPSSATNITCHGISNPMSTQLQQQQRVDTCQDVANPLSTQHVLPTVVVESSRQKDEPPPPPYPVVVATNCAETLPPPDYSSLFPKTQTSSPSLSSS